MTEPAVRRQAVRQIIGAYGYSERRTCQLIELNRRTLRRVPPDRDEDLRKRLRELAEERRRFGCPRLYLLLRREGLVVNHKRVERLYRSRCAGKFREECLNANVFLSLASARDIIEAWRQDYNTSRPHNALGGLAPEEYGRAMNEENQTGQSPSLRVGYSAG